MSKSYEFTKLITEELDTINNLGISVEKGSFSVHTAEGEVTIKLNTNEFGGEILSVYREG